MTDRREYCIEVSPNRHANVRDHLARLRVELAHRLVKNAEYPKP